MTNSYVLTLLVTAIILAIISIYFISLFIQYRRHLTYKSINVSSITLYEYKTFKDFKHIYSICIQDNKIRTFIIKTPYFKLMNYTDINRYTLYICDDYIIYNMVLIQFKFIDWVKYRIWSYDMVGT